MRVTIIKDDGVVGINGVFRKVDLSSFEVRAVQWDGQAGHIENSDGTNVALTEITAFQPYIDLWTAAAPPPPPPPTLADIKTAQISILTAAYNTAIQQPVAYMGTTFQADSDSQTKVMAVLAAMTPVGATPTGFYWVDAPNNRVPMTLAQVQGLAQAMMNQGWTAFQNLQARKASVNAATTIPDVQAVVW